ncbi:MAG: O-antigen ligase family protein [Sedimentisphaerales bacterium]
MTDTKTKIDNSKNKFLALLETLLFPFCIAVIVLRATSSEAPTPQSSPIQAVLNDTVFSLCVSGILIFTFLIWCLAKLFSNRPSFKISSSILGLVFLITGIIITTLYAANKRSAITSAVTLLAPIFMAIMLTCLLDSHTKIKILLITLASLGVVAFIQSADQFFIENNLMIQQYQDDPDAMLQQLGIQKNSFNHILLEHRLYSKDVRSFFTTGNSAGSFAILTSFAAIALLAEILKNRKSFPKLSGNRALAVLLIAFILLGLLLTRSKGAIGAFFFTIIIFFFLMRSKRPKLPKNIILAVCLVGILALAYAAALYGLRTGRLPGGNSMLVRWQYWDASAKMFLDKHFLGVGGGNFSSYYPQYKTPSAPETVSDPHCFALSILTQYGPLALLGFLIIILVPLWRNSLDDNINLETTQAHNFINLATLCALVTAVVLIVLRPFILPQTAAPTFDEKIYVLFSLYAAPAAAFAVGVALFAKTLQTSPKEYNLQNTHITSIALFCGILGFIIHNLIDFAIFEPGILTAFFASLACLIALNAKTENQPKPAISSPLWLKTAAVIGALLIGFAYFNYTLLPVVESTSNIAKARPSMMLGQVQLAHSFLDAATIDDPLSSDAPSQNGNLYIQEFYRSDVQKEQLFNNAEQALFIAAERNPRDYRIFDSLSELYSIYARLQPEQNEALLNKALDSASIAVELYPGDAELHFKLAQIADELGRMDLALKNYKVAVQIEDGFRKQFKLMYPGRKVLSRLDEDKYFSATQRIKDLEQKPLR